MKGETKMKKLLFLALLLVVAMLAFAACGGGNGAGVEATPVPTPAPPVTPPPTPAPPPPVDPVEPTAGLRDELLARAAEMVPVPGSYIINATGTRPDANQLSSVWSNPSPNAQARVLMAGISIMSRNHLNEFFPNPIVSYGGEWAQITDCPDTGNRTYTFTIYTDLRFSDGTPINAYHFAGGIAFNVSYQWAAVAPSAPAFMHLAYRAPFISGEIDTLPSVRVYNESQFSVTKYGRYLPNFWEASANMNFAPLALHVYGIEAHDDGDGVYLTAIGGGDWEVEDLRSRIHGGEVFRVYLLDQDDEYMYDANGNRLYAEFGDGLKYTNPVVTGPYVFESVDVGNGVLTMVANPYFPGTWDGYRPRIERVIWRMIPTPLIVDALATGLAHISENVSEGVTIETGMDVLVGGGTHTFITYPQNGQLFTQFHVDTGPTQFVEVRQAIAFLQDREAMNEDIGRGFTAVQHGPWSDAWWWHQEAVDRGLYDRVHFYSLNIARAMDLLEAGGWNYNEDGTPWEHGSGEIRHKWVDEWGWSDADGNITDVIADIVRVYMEDGVHIRSNKVYTGDQVLMPLVIDWLVRAIDYPFRDALEVTFFDNVAYVGGLVVQHRRDDWSPGLSSGYRFAGGRFNMHTLGVTMAITWSPWVQAGLENIPAQNWAQSDSPTHRDLAANIRAADITTEEGRNAFIEAYMDYMEFRTYYMLTIPFNSAVVHDFVPVELGGWFNTSLWAFPEAVQRAYWR